MTKPAAAQFSAPVTTVNGPNRTNVLTTFDVCGIYTWTVPPKTKTVTFDVFGASGGRGFNQRVNGVISSGGNGGEATATFAVQTGQTL